MSQQNLPPISPQELPADLPSELSANSSTPTQTNIDWVGTVPFILMHLAPFLAIWSGVRIRDVVLCVTLYYVRMFFITAGYHRYFAHRSYKLSRVSQFLFAWGGSMAAQKGVLWWAGHHRDHHKHSDQEEDIHSPRKGFLWSHLGWFLCRQYVETPYDRIKDFAKFPELRWLNRNYLVPPTVLAVLVWLGFGWSGLFIGFFLSTVLLYHGTFTINSLAHLIGRKRYKTKDDSRNSLVLALLTLGEGWHNNHHYYQASARQGFFWWEVDVSYYVLVVLSWVGIVKDLKRPPSKVLTANLMS